MVQEPPPAIADYVQRRALEHKLEQSKPEVIDAGPEPKIKSSLGKGDRVRSEDAEINPDPPPTSKKDHFDDFLGIGVTQDAGIGR